MVNSLKRKLAAILSADVAGYRRLMPKNKSRGNKNMFLMKNYLFNKHGAFKILSLSIVLILLSFVNQKTVYSEEGKIIVNGSELYYKIMGSGEPIVILHGGPGLEHTYLLPQMGELAKNYKLIFYDQRTSGGSICSTDSSAITLDNFVQDLEAIRNAFNLGKMNLMGHSWGGMLAMFYGIKYPENLNSLMLIGSGGARSEFWNDTFKNIDNNRTEEDGLALANLKASEGYKNNDISTHQKYYKIFFKAYFYDQALADHLSVELSETTIKNTQLISTKPLGQEVNNYDIVDQLSTIKCPTIIIHGENDVIPIKYAEEINNNLDNSEFVHIQKCGHFPYIETPNKFFSLIRDFMENLPKDQNN